MSGTGAREKRRGKRIHLQVNPHTFENGFVINDRADATKVCRLLYCIEVGDEVSIKRFSRSKRVFELAYAAGLLKKEGDNTALLTQEAKEFINHFKNKHGKEINFDSKTN